MVDEVTGTERAEPMGPGGAFGAARELLYGAELDAARTRTAAARYARQRELEADLLVQKARRLLEAAEQKAAVIVATARTQAPAATDDVIDLDEMSHVIAPQGAVLSHRRSPSRLDEMLASAITHAVTDAFPVDIPA